MLRILQVAIMVATICCCCCLAQTNEGLACTDSRLDDIVHRISKTRFETRDTKPKLARCQTFVQLIRGQSQESLAESLPRHLASDETPKGLLGELAKILELRASCRHPMGGLHSLREFIEDCRELSELRDQLREQAKVATAGMAMAQEVLVPGTTGEIVVHKDAQGRLGPIWSRSVYGSIFMTQVTAGTPAARAGLRFGDQLIEVNGRPTAGKELSKMIEGLNPVRFLVRSRPMEQNFVIKPRQGEQQQQQHQKPRSAWFKWMTRDNKTTDKARASGILEGFKLIAVNGESVVGLDSARMTDLSRRQSKDDEFTVTFIPQDFYERLTHDMNLDEIRTESNKILADENRSARL